MAQRFQLGALVTRSMQWFVDSQQVGLVVGSRYTGSDIDWLVMWSVGNDRTKFSWHMDDALKQVNDQEQGQ